MTPTRPTSRTLLLTGLALLLTACSADVSGTVYVSTKSGHARRGVDVPVLLVHEQFMGEWTEASAPYKASYREAVVAFVDARARLQRSREDYYGRSRTGYRVPDGRSYEEAGERLREAASRVESVRREWSEHTASLARAATVKTSRTDVNGRYEFRRVPRGKYYVMASHKLFGDELFWLVPVEVRGKEAVDLSSSNRSYPFDLIRGDADVARAVAAPVSSPLPRETPHQPKWLAEELAKEKQGIVDRREARGTWQLVQTVFRRRASAGEKFEDILKEIVTNPDRFQSQAVVAGSLAKDECRTVANRVSDAARVRGDRRYDHQDGVALVRTDREAADTSGWTTRPRIEDSITVQVWVCENTVKDAASR